MIQNCSSIWKCTWYWWRKNKIWISNFHKVEGIERKHMFVINFHFTYFKYYGKNMQSTRLPNIFYVALSQALCTLHVINHKENAIFAFIKREGVEQHCNYNKILNCVFNWQQNTDHQIFPNRNVRPSQILYHTMHNVLCVFCQKQRKTYMEVLKTCQILTMKSLIYFYRDWPIIQKIRKLCFGNIWMVSKHKICHRTYVLDNYNMYAFSDMCAITYLATAICSYRLVLIFWLKQ